MASCLVDKMVDPMVGWSVISRVAKSAALKASKKVGGWVSLWADCLVE